MKRRSIFSWGLFFSSAILTLALLISQNDRFSSARLQTLARAGELAPLVLSPATVATPAPSADLPPITAALLAGVDDAKPALKDGSIVDQPVFASEPQAALRSLAPSAAPTINLWYGATQNFGQHGNPQRWVNILGDVQDSNGIASLVYALNGGPAQMLGLGADGKRLAETGDFNIELDTLTLPNGANQLLITATNTLNQSVVQSVQVNYQAGQTTPLPYTANWSSVTNIQDLAQVVDGKWAIETNVLRPQVFDYDRLVAIGDQTWTDYEVTVPVKLHSMDPSGFGGASNGPGIGILTRWSGHFQANNEQPRTGWQNIGALAWYRWRMENNVAVVGMVMNGFGGGQIAERPDLVPAFDVDYIFKMRVESNPGATTTYSFKVWEANQSEPGAWDMVGQGKAGEPPTGSIVLVAHHVDASFGTVMVTPLAPNRVTLALNTVGDGTVQRNPNLVDYPYGQYIKLNAAGGIGQMLSGWSGDYAGNANPGAVTLTSNANITATFGPAVGSLASDDFNRCTLGVAPWSFVDPLGDSTLQLNGTQALFTLPNGVSHDVWSNVYSAPRILQAAPSGDFSIEVKFDSAPTANTQAQGILVEQDASNFLRFDFQYTTSLRAYVGRVVSGAGTQLRNRAIVGSPPLYLRVIRTGDVWMQQYSFDGVTWLNNNNGNPVFTHVMKVNKVGLFAANTAANPAHNVQIDYFAADANPLTSDDSSGLRPLLRVVGNGSITLDPDQNSYNCGDVLTVTAVPLAGWTFAGWSGALSGADNPTTLPISGGQVLTATFAQHTYTLNTSVVGDGGIDIQPLKKGYNGGEIVALTATASAGWTFSGWSGALTGDANPAMLVMDGDKNVTATFVELTPTPTATATPTNTPTPTATETDALGDTATPTPTVTATETASATAAPGDTATATATAVPGDTATPAATSTSSATATPAPGATATATVTPIAGATVTATATNTSSPADPATPTATTTATATDPALPVDTATATATPSATATSVPNAGHELAIQPVVGGQVIADPPGPSYSAGQVVTLTALPDPGWVFVRWQISTTVAAAQDDLTTPTIAVTIPDDRQFQAIFALTTVDHTLFLPFVSSP